MSYRREFGLNWRHVVAATLGMSAGLSLSHYTNSLFAPELIAEFGWSKAQYALIGSTTFVTMFLVPFIGRFTDHVGPRVAAAIGFSVLPLGYLALSLMTGNFALFFAITIFKGLFGVMTTTLVFARVVVERFDNARGLALSIIMTGPPLCSALATPLIAGIIADHGWRSAYHALAAFSIVGGLITLLLLGRGRAPQAPRAPRVRFQRSELIALARSPVFRLAIGGMLLVNIPQVLAASQLKLVLQESSAPGALATGLVALYAAGVAVGRVISGLALDRIEPHKVAIAALGFPAVGLVVLASPFDAAWALTGAVLLIGLAQGAEGDIGAYLVSRKFGIENYSLIMSFMTLALTLGGASGALLLSLTLKLTDRYDVFLLAGAVATVIGAGLFYLTGRFPGAKTELRPVEASA